MSRCLWLVPLLLAGCSGTRVRVGDGVVEAPLQEVTGVDTAAVARAKDKPAVGLWDAYAFAVERTERLAVEYEDVEQSRAHAEEAIGSYLPQVSLKGSKGYQQSVPGVAPPVQTVFLNVHQPLITGLNEVAALKGASHERWMRISLLRHDAGRLLLDVARAYYTVIQTQESLRTELSTQEITKKMLAQERVFRDQGRIRQSDLLSTEAQLAQGDAVVSTLQDQLVQARENLANLTGMEPDRELALDDPAGFPEYQGTLEDAVHKSGIRWDVRASYEAYQMAKDQLLAAEGSRLPSLAADGDYYLDRTGGSNPGKWDAMLSVQIPIFNLAGLEGKAREYQSKKRQAALALTQALRSAKEEIREAFQAYQNSLKEDEAYQKALTATQKSHDAMEQDYSHHLMNIVDYLKSVSDLEQAELARARSRTQWRIQRVWLGVATGEFPVTHALPSGEAAPAVSPEVKP